MKPRYLVLAPLAVLFGMLFVEIGLLAKYAEGGRPVVYRRALWLFVIGLVLAGLGFQGSRRLFRRN